MGKIIKYEFRSMFRLFIPLWLGILVLSLVNRFTLNFQFGDNKLANFFAGMVMFLYVMGIMAVLVVAFIFIILRFYKGILKEEGYLTMTLPVSLDSILWGKAIAGWVLLVLTVVVCIASAGILVLQNFMIEDVRLAWARMAELSGGEAPLVLILVQVLLSALVSTLYNILFLYLAMAIGHLAQKHKVGMSVLAYVVLSTVLSTLYNTFLTPAVLNFLMGYDFAGRTNAQIVALVSNSLWIYLAIVLVACVVFYFPTRYILQKKLNLE